MWDGIKNSVLDLCIRFEIFRKHLNGTIRWADTSSKCRRAIWATEILVRVIKKIPATVFKAMKMDMFT